MKLLIFTLLLVCSFAHAKNKEYRVVYQSFDGRQLNCLVRAQDKNLALVVGSDCCYAAMFDLSVPDLIDVCTNPIVEERK